MTSMLFSQLKVNVKQHITWNNFIGSSIRSVWLYEYQLIKGVS